MTQTLKSLGLVIVSLLWAGQAFADHDVSEIASAAHDFAQAANHFHQVIHDRTGYSHLAQDVHRLADSADHFHHAAEGGASYQHLLNDFNRIAQAYNHVRTAFYHAHGIHHDHHVQADFQRVEYTYEDLYYAVRGF